MMVSATIDYEIYGNGEGSLKIGLRAVGKLMKAKLGCFVTFVELAEIEMLEVTDGTGNDMVRRHYGFHQED
jgi:hypothetical protein